MAKLTKKEYNEILRQKMDLFDLILKKTVEVTEYAI